MRALFVASFVATLGLVAGGSASAQAVTVPHVFAAGTPAKAGEVNDNFQALAAAINSLQVRLAKQEGQLGAADLVGSYRVQGYESTLNPPSGDNVRFVTTLGTLTLAADGSGTYTVTETGNKLQISGGRTTDVNAARSGYTLVQPTRSISWSYSGGTLSTMGSTYSVLDGGKLLIRIATGASDNASSITVFTRSN